MRKSPNVTSLGDVVDTKVGRGTVVGVYRSVKVRLDEPTEYARSLVRSVGGTFPRDEPHVLDLPFSAIQHG